MYKVFSPLKKSDSHCRHVLKEKEKSRSKEQKFKDILGVNKCEATSCTGDLAVVIIEKATELQRK